MNYCKVKKANNIINKNFAFYFAKRIIHRMKEISRKIWEIGFPAFVVLLVGSTQPLYFMQSNKFQLLVSIILFILALICLIVAILAFRYDFTHTWKREHPDVGFGFSNGKNNDNQSK